MEANSNQVWKRTVSLKNNKSFWFFKLNENQRLIGFVVMKEHPIPWRNPGAWMAAVRSDLHQTL
jgi:hypothetical protein